MTNSVKDYGAYGDGVHDDYAAFQAALDLRTGTVTVPPGWVWRYQKPASRCPDAGDEYGSFPDFKFPIYRQ